MNNTVELIPESNCTCAWSGDGSGIQTVICPGHKALRLLRHHLDQIGPDPAPIAEPGGRASWVKSATADQADEATPGR